MGIDINPFDILMSWVQSKEKGNERIADYLDSIANEAERLAEAWQEVALKLDAFGKRDNRDIQLEIGKKSIDALGFANDLNNNYQPYYRLIGFYKNISKVMGEKHQGDLELIIFRIGSLLAERNITKEYAMNVIKNISSEMLFQEYSGKYKDISLFESVEVLHREAAQLHEFAIRFRANHKLV